VDSAEKAILSMGKKDKTGKIKIGITTSKIRNLLAMISEIYNDAMHTQGDSLDEDMQSRIAYLKMRFAYEAGREPAVKDFVKKAEIFEAIDSIGKNKEQLIVFCHYMEALVAYRKYYFGND
jgi:CRISPR-associated protein Csm2